MNSTDPVVSPLRQRMLDDMRMRKLGAKTQTGYVRGVRRFAAFLGRSPDTATAEALRRFQLDLVDHGASPTTINSTLSALKFFFDVTLGHGELMAKIQPVRVPTKLPVVLSPEEVSRLIAAAPNLKHRTALAVAYGAGLRASEVCALKVGDVDSQRMVLRVEQGKGRKDRYALLSPALLLRRARHDRARTSASQRPSAARARRPVRCRMQRPRPTRPMHLSSRPHPGPQRRRLAHTLSFSDARSGAPSATVTRLAAIIPIAASASTTVATRAAVSSLELCPTPALRPRIA